MDALIAKGSEGLRRMKISHFHYGDWTYRQSRCFSARNLALSHMIVRAYFVPLNWRGQLAVNAKLHRSLRERLPQPWIEQLAGMRAKYYTWKYGTEPVPAAT